ncbi:hypothetical protein GP5015_2155 [gamma proteobacterium HTCC5015]|nr:hypothetical protein GP5015_2155 [gamma proteobacterium HTCC5015]
MALAALWDSSTSVLDLALYWKGRSPIVAILYREFIKKGQIKIDRTKLTA